MKAISMEIIFPGIVTDMSLRERSIQRIRTSKCVSCPRAPSLHTDAITTRRVHRTTGHAELLTWYLFVENFFYNERYLMYNVSKNYFILIILLYFFLFESFSKFIILDYG